MIYTTVHTEDGNVFVVDDGFGPNDDNGVFYEDHVMHVCRHLGEFPNNQCRECMADLFGLQS